jgi:hypothetical protein
MCDVLGELWFKDVFLAHCGPERPQLLFLDSHRSHEVLGDASHAALKTLGHVCLLMSLFGWSYKNSVHARS